MSEPQQEPQEQQFIIQRIYVKDVSFEAPNSPGIFTQEWNPNTNLDLNTKVNTLANDNYEVELFITITVKSDDKTAFLVEVKQAGVFFIHGLRSGTNQPFAGCLLPEYPVPVCA